MIFGQFAGGVLSLKDHCAFSPFEIHPPWNPKVSGIVISCCLETFEMLQNKQAKVSLILARTWPCKQFPTHKELEGAR